MAGKLEFEASSEGKVDFSSPGMGSYVKVTYQRTVEMSQDDFTRYSQDLKMKIRPSIEAYGKFGFTRANILGNGNLLQALQRHLPYASMCIPEKIREPKQRIELWNKEHNLKEGLTMRQMFEGKKYGYSMKSFFMPVYENLYKDLEGLRRSGNLPAKFYMLKALKVSEKFTCLNNYKDGSAGWGALYRRVFEEVLDNEKKMDHFLESIFSHSESKSIQLYSLDEFLKNMR